MTPEERRDYQAAWQKTPRGKACLRRWYLQNYVPHPHEERNPTPEEAREIERRTAAIRLLKERGMMLRGREEPCSG